jgi:hypothetical protein
MAERTIMTKGLGGKKASVITFGKVDPDLKTWKYGGCGKNRCGMPSTPKEHKEEKTWMKEDAKFYRKAVQNTGYGKNKKAMQKISESGLGVKSGEWLKGYGT